MIKSKNKKGQVAVFVIIAIVIVAIVAALFLLNKAPTITAPGGYDFQSSIEKCARDATSRAAEAMIPQGGFLHPQNYKNYMNINVTYLCQNIGYFKPCISQHPMLINEETNEIKNYAEPIIQQCFSDAQSEMQNRGYDATMGDMQVAVSLGPSRIYTSITRDVTISKNGQTQIFNNFNVELLSPLYDLSNVAITIASQEAKYCYFEYVGYMILYPRWQISKFTFSDSTRIYSIEDKQSRKTMNIAIRGCAIPPGI